MRQADRAQIANTIHNGEYWLRCPYCGDSDKDPEKAHYSIQLRTGVFFCLRCQTSGKLNKKDQYELMGTIPLVTFNEAIQEDDDSDEALERILDNLVAGAHITMSRRSLLERWTYRDDRGAFWDAFISYDLSDGEPIGVLLRSIQGQKRAYFYGSRGYAWPGDELPRSVQQPLRLVEGPYDVLAPNDICVFGLITKYTLMDFVGHNIILCPDGDVWQKESLRRSFFASLRYLMYSKQKKPYLVGVEYLARGKDPDEVPISERPLFTAHEITELLRRF